MDIPRNFFLTGVLATLSGCHWPSATEPPTCVYTPPPETGGHVADAFLDVGDKVPLGLAFARAILKDPKLRQAMEAKAQQFRRLGTCGKTECDPSTASPLWQTYAGWITTATHYVADPANNAPALGRGDVVDILWVTANFFLGAAARLGGFPDQKGLEWPAESVDCNRRAHMVPLFERGATTVTLNDVPFDVPLIATKGEEALSPPAATTHASASDCPPPSAVTPPPATLSKEERVIVGKDVAIALTYKHPVRQRVVNKAGKWRKNDPNSECDPEFAGHAFLWKSYRKEILTASPRATKLEQNKKKNMTRTDVVDVLWVAQNFFLSAVGAVTGYSGDTLFWPKEPADATKRRQAAQRATGGPLCKVHMVALPPIGGTEITQCYLDFPLPNGTGDKSSCRRPS
jgi:hypothetical protein